MRGRKPRPIEVAPEDLPVLQQIAQSQTRPWYQVRRARILLGIAEGGRTQTLAFQTQCNESTVRRTCHRYERLGLSDLLDSPPRSGRGCKTWFGFLRRYPAFLFLVVLYVR